MLFHTLRELEQGRNGMLELVEPSEPVMRLIPLTVHGSEAMNVYAVTCDVAAMVDVAALTTLVDGLLALATYGLLLYVLLMFFCSYF